MPIQPFALENFVCIVSPNRVNTKYPIQLWYDKNNPDSPDRDQLILMNNFRSDLVDANEAVGKLVDEIRAFNTGKSDIYPENLRQRVIKILKSVKQNKMNTKLVKGFSEGPTAWDVISAQREQLIALLKNPEYVFKKADYGFVFCPKSRQLNSQRY